MSSLSNFIRSSGSLQPQVEENTERLVNTSNENLLLNSDFRFWQRGTSLTPTGFDYTADRWIVNAFAPSGTVTATSGNARNGTFIGITHTGATNNGLLVQRIYVKGKDYNDYEGQKLTASIRGRSSVDNTPLRVSCGWVDSSGTAASGFNYSAFGEIGTGTSGDTQTFTWEVPTITSFSTSESYCLQFEIIYGDTSTPPVSVNFYTAKVEFGDKATKYEYPDTLEEFAKCKRYYHAVATTERLAVLYAASNGVHLNYPARFAANLDNMHSPITVTVTPDATVTTYLRSVDDGATLHALSTSASNYVTSSVVNFRVTNYTNYTTYDAASQYLPQTVLRFVADAEL